MSDERKRKAWCKVDVVDCTCASEQCEGDQHRKIIEQWNTLVGYGLTSDEAIEDMKEPNQ